MSALTVLGPAAVAFDGRELEMHVPLPDPVAALLAQRRRLAEALAGLGDDGWQSPTRCHLWDVADCVTHMIDTNRWAEHALAVACDPSLPPLFETFDNRVTPHELVLAQRGRSPKELVDDLLISTERAAAKLTAAMGQPDHPDVRFAFGSFRPFAAALHLLWDSVLHERDVVLPLGLAAGHGDDEVACVSAYIFVYAGVACGPFDPPQAVDITLRDRVERSYRLVTGGRVEVHPGGPGAPGGPATSRLLGQTGPVIDALAGRVPLDAAVTVDGPFAERLPLTPARLQPDPV